MQCPFCGTQLASTAQICTTCGNAVNANSQGDSEPTQYAGPIDPNQVPPPPAYGYGTPPPPAYGAPQTPPVYGTPPPSAYGAPQSSSAYGTPPPAYGAPQSSSPYNQPYPSQGTPYQPIPGQMGTPYGGNAPYGGAIPGYMPPQKKPKSRVGLIIGIVALVLVVLCVGGSVLAYRIGTASDQTDTLTGTPTVAQTATAPYKQKASPSGTAIDPQAAAIIINPQATTKIDKDSLEPVKGSTSSTFKTNQSIYITFDLDPKKFDASKDTDYVNTRFYVGSESVVKDDPLKLGPDNFNGYFSITYDEPTTEGAVELYWCHTAACSDAKLAQVLYFTVTA